MSTILITGGAGFIGTNLCKRLLKEGNKVICVDNLYTGQMRNIQPLMSNPNFKFINHNIIEPLKVKEKLIKFTIWHVQHHPLIIKRIQYSLLILVILG